MRGLTGSISDRQEVRNSRGEWVEICASSKYHAQVILDILIVADCIHQMLGCRVRELKHPLHSPLDRVKVLVKASRRSLGVCLLGSAIVAAEERG